MVKRTTKQREVVDNLHKFYLPREGVINFFNDHAKMILNLGYKAKQDETKGAGRQILTLNKCFKDYQ